MKISGMRIRLALTMAMAMAMCAGASHAAPLYEFDLDHTHVTFLVDHMGFSHMPGRLKVLSGALRFDPTAPSASQVSATLAAASIATDVAALDRTLAGSDWLDAARFPTMRFESGEVKVTGPHSADVTGNLTLHGVTRLVTLHTVYHRSGMNPFSNRYSAGFSADGSFSRSAFGISGFLPAVGDEVAFHIEAEAAQPFAPEGGIKGARR